MRGMAWMAAGVGAALIAAAACGSSSNGGGTSDGDGGPGTGDGGANPTGCPSSVPGGGSACTPEGLRCSYGACPQTVWACSNSLWMEFDTFNNAGCPPPETDHCAEGGGKCLCGGTLGTGFTIAPPRFSCAQSSGGCGRVCYVPIDGGCGGATCTLNQACLSCCNDNNLQCVDQQCADGGLVCSHSCICPADAGADG